jgi:hypothetical protein
MNKSGFKSGFKEQAAEAKRLGDRAERLAEMCGEMARTDPFESPLSLETNALTEICGLIRGFVDTDKMRLTSAMRIVDVLFDLQEDAIKLRKEQIGKHTKS